MARSAFSTYSIFQTINLLHDTPSTSPFHHVARVDIYQKFQLSFIASTGVCFAFSSTVRGGAGGGGGGRTRNWTCISLDFSPVTRYPQEYTHTQPQPNSLKIRNPPPPSAHRLATWQFSLDAQVKIFDTPLQIFCTTTRDNCSVFPRTQVEKPARGLQFPFFLHTPHPSPFQLDLTNVLPQSSA